jgi:acyl-CoA reductase-like NAD-dependent aldehyde dehydrogenase
MSLTPMRIDGRPVTTEEESIVRSPFDGREVGRVPTGSADDVDAAVAVALARHRAGALPTHQRAEILDAAAVALTARQEEFAQSISTESAKPIKTARVEAQRAVDTFRFAAVAARSASGEMVPLDASVPGVGKLGFTLRVPIGVVAAISPFNFPLNLVAHKVAPAIATGCPVVLKPASATPLTALLLADLLENDAGLPPGWLNVVTVPGRVADRLVTHEDVALITFTGSPPVGWDIRARAPRKRVGLELGNNAPVIIEPGTDVQDIAARISVAGYSFAGQSCISVQRVYVHDSVADEFLDAFAAKVEALVVGDPAEDTTDVSSLISAKETERVEASVDEALGEGAKVLVGGDRSSDGVYRPTIVTDVTPQMDVCVNEIFGPVVGVQRYSQVEDAFAMANDSRYGLQAGILTPDIATALAAVRTLDFGGVTVNEVPTWRADQMPYGGIRDSGNTKEGPAWAVREMTEERMVIIQG